MPGQLKVLLSGRHPKTFEPILKPIALNVWLARDSDVGNLSTAITVWRGRGSEDWPIQGPPNLEDDGSAFTQAFIRKGVRPIDTNRPSLLQRIRAKQQQQQQQQQYLQTPPQLVHGIGQLVERPTAMHDESAVSSAIGSCGADGTADGGVASRFRILVKRPPVELELQLAKRPRPLDTG